MHASRYIVLKYRPRSQIWQSRNSSTAIACSKLVIGTGDIQGGLPDYFLTLLNNGRWGQVKMDTTWYELQTSGMDVEQREISLEEFERLFNADKTPYSTVD